MMLTGYGMMKKMKRVWLEKKTKEKA